MAKKIPARPVFGKDYDLGWVGFVCGPSLLSSTISYLTRRDKIGKVVATHTLLVTGADECVEANYPAGVVVTNLTESYFGKESNGHVVFRKPKGLSKAAARRLVRRAKAEVGAGFDTVGMIAEGLGGTFVGAWLNNLLGDKPKEMAAGLLHQKGKFVCSDLVVHCFRSEPKYRGKGIVARPPGTVSPQALYEDEDLFEPLPAKQRGTMATDRRRAPAKEKK